MPQPTLDGFFDQLCSRYAWDFGALSGGFGIASGIAVGSNPPWTATDFLTLYPKFGGTPLTMQGTLTIGSPVVAGDPTGVDVGQLVVGSGVPSGATVLSVGSGEFTLTVNATASGAVTVAVITAPFVPLAVINAYIALASASVMQSRWCEMWQLGMALFVAHYLTLWLKSDGSVYTTAGQAAAAGLKQGITVSVSAAGVSQSLQPIPGMECWGTFSMTGYGVQFVDHAKCLGAGAIYVS